MSTVQRQPVPAAPAALKKARTDAKLAVDSVSMVFGTDSGPLSVLDGVAIQAANGEFVSIIGTSGCGKSTLFNIIAGLEMPAAGTIYIDGADVTGRLGLVAHMPQKDLLMPWKTVLDNTTIGLELLGVSKRRAREEALDLFPRFGLEGFERAYPGTLSGGMRQRAALLRTVLARRDIFLLDEPFGALDALTRADMQCWLLDIWASVNKTILFITHDIDEAIYLSDRVYVMSPRPGRIVDMLDIPFSRPRVYEDVVTSRDFAEIKRDLLASLGGAGAKGKMQ